ncbi:hypothetical protein [Natrinema altunense]|uniref:Uncharacterized protein n=1 Tax=Natrinema altunense (strain JCM 12890 / CGMCC 1.3731 / AJ2) TaxID=1227494 RepID=L9ZEI9_NATA2|nr:hypothetical protein [Natrinema altunense]ELY84451.1 hypothetical protein C485_13875 [Natrinema altunense JCM 12890]
MALQRLLRGDPSKSSKVYLAIGLLSLVKAIAVRNDRDRFRREIVDAGLFLGVGFALRRFSRVKAQKRRELESQIPDWAADVIRSEATSTGLQTIAKRHLGSRSEPEPKTVRERARSVFSNR